MHALIISYTLKSKVPFNMLRLQLYCAHALHRVTNEEQCKKLLSNEFSHYGKFRQKRNKARGKPYRAIANQHLVSVVGEKNWNTMEDKSKSNNCSSQSGHCTLIIQMWYKIYKAFTETYPVCRIYSVMYVRSSSPQLPLVFVIGVVVTQVPRLFL